MFGLSQKRCPGQDSPIAFFAVFMDAILAILAQASLQVSRGCLLLSGRLMGLKPLAPEARVRHVVIYRIGNIGDTVVALPALFYLRQRFSAAHITLITSAGTERLPGATEVLAPFEGLVDAIIPYQSGQLKSMRGLVAMREQVEATGGLVDLFVDLPVTMQDLKRGLQEQLLARVLDSRAVLGFELLLPPLFKTAWSRRYPARIERTSDWLLRVVNPQSDAVTARAAHIAPMPWQEWGLDAHRPLLAVNPGAKLAIKRWPPDAFARLLIGTLKESPRLQVAFIGNEEEELLNQRIVEAVREGLPGQAPTLVNLSGKLSIGNSWSLVSAAQAVLSNDTGTMHMAGLLNRPVFAPMSGQYPAPLWHPPGASLVAFRQAVPCSPCFRETCTLPEQICMTRIGAEDIQPALSQVLAD